MGIILLILLFPFTGFGANSFPWDAKHSVSPNGRYELFWKKVAGAKLSKGGAALYELFLRDLQTHVDRSVGQFEGTVNVIWAPDDNHFALTYHWGSNVAFIKIYPSRDIRNPIDPYDNIKSALRRLPEVEYDNHIYFHALRWRDKDRLWIRLFGHWDTSGAKEFDYYFEISLKGGARPLSQIEIETVKNH